MHPITAEPLCDEFEAAIRAGETPRISEFTSRVDPGLAPYLASVLAAIEEDYRAAAEPTPLRDPAIHLGTYELQDTIGSGSHGTVWKAWHPKKEQFYAIKIPVTPLDDSEQLATFRNEAKSAGALDHPNIVQVIGFGESDDRAYIVFDLVEGITLKVWKLARAHDHNDATRIVRTIADAISYAHSLGIVHRDLKPSNILMDFDDVPHITDFGLAKRQDAESTIAVEGVIMGSVPYMSPEQIIADHDDVGPASDIYSLGVILHELLTGRLPFTGSRVKLMRDIVEKTPPRMKGVPVDLRTICLKCLRKKPSERYPTAADLRDDLQRYMDGQPIRARRYTMPDLIRKYWPIAILCMIVAAIFAQTDSGSLVDDATLRSITNSVAPEVVPAPTTYSYTELPWLHGTIHNGPVSVGDTAIIELPSGDVVMGKIPASDGPTGPELYDAVLYDAATVEQLRTNVAYAIDLVQRWL